MSDKLNFKVKRSFVSKTRKLVIGLEGGGTKTTLILTDTIGHKILTINGPASNPISGSISNTCDVIDELINKISNELEHLEIYHSFHNGFVDWRGKCVAVGIALSGGSSKKVKSEILNYFKNDTSLNQSLADKIVVLTDPQAAIASCCLKSGMTMIAGTGSICYLFSNIDKFFFDKAVSSRVGGWGYMFSDEGSAFDITKICLKTVFDFYDSFGIGNINKGERFLKEKGVQELRDALFAHFCCSSLTQLCAKIHPPHFNKTRFAGFAIEAYQLAIDGNFTCSSIFRENIGPKLANQIVSLLSQLSTENEVSMITQGSVWKSWNLLKPEFLRTLKMSKNSFKPRTIKMVKLPDHAGGLGAARLGLMKFCDTDFF